LSEYYRCPPLYDRFIEAGKSLSGCGCFRFGDQICYGRLSSGHVTRSVEDKLYDASGDVRVDGSAVRLPFDAKEIIENLRRETYASGFPGQSTFLGRAIRSAYYGARPFLPVSVRKPLQRI